MMMKKSWHPCPSSLPVSEDLQGAPWLLPPLRMSIILSPGHLDRSCVVECAIMCVLDPSTIEWKD